MPRKRSSVVCAAWPIQVGNEPKARIKVETMKSQSRFFLSSGFVKEFPVTQQTSKAYFLLYRKMRKSFHSLTACRSKCSSKYCKCGCVSYPAWVNSSMDCLKIMNHRRETPQVAESMSAAAVSPKICLVTGERVSVPLPRGSVI